jgi:hypothetical protein
MFYLISSEAVLLTGNMRKPANIVMNLKQKNERWPDRKASRAYGGNAGLAFAMCEARKKRKNRQGAPKLFSVLIFGYFPSRESN